MTNDEAGQAVTVLRCITRLNIGGPARQELAVSKHFPDRYRSVLVAGTVGRDEGELVDSAVDVLHVGMARPLSPMKDLSAAIALRLLFRRYRPAILHTHLAKAGALGRFVARGSSVRPRLVHTFHGHVFEGYFSPRQERAFLFVEKQLAKRTDALVAVSPEVRDELLALGVGREEQWHVIPIGLELDVLARAQATGALRRELRVSDGIPLVGVLGRLVSVKNHKMALEVIRNLSDVHLAVIGDGGLRGQLEAMARDLRIEHRVHFLGWRIDLEGLLPDLDLMILTSENEGTPVSLIEAQAVGLPVVATNVGGVPYVVTDGVDGFLVTPGDKSSLTSRMEKVLSDAELSQRLGKAGRLSAGRFTIDRHVDRLVGLYESLL